MNPEPLLLALDERNLAHFLAAIALAGIAERESALQQPSGTCRWAENGKFEIDAGLTKNRLFTAAHDYVGNLNWSPSPSGPAAGVIACGDELGANPYISLQDSRGRMSALKVFSGNVRAAKFLSEQKLRPPSETSDWLRQVAYGAGRWGFDSELESHASDLGFSSDAEGTSNRDPVFPAIERLSLAGASFFAPVHIWQTSVHGVEVFAWCNPIPLAMAGLVSTGRVRGMAGSKLAFARRPAGHGDAGNYKFFPEASPAGA
ncbi:MAG: hypothetical protein EPN33_06655 [Acidobacteria bacterium]|nr:MAG: hypothetical protein EPN33_06655 [Acidobacteriota bacterium]